MMHEIDELHFTDSGIGEIMLQLECDGLDGGKLTQNIVKIMDISPLTTVISAIERPEQTEVSTD